MAEQSYLRWLVNETATTWWHDSADPDELRQGLAHGATGVTTNPVLTSRALRSSPEKWGFFWRGLSDTRSPEGLAEALMQHVVRNAARMLEPVYEHTEGRLGYVCAQVNPAKAADRETMTQMARRLVSLLCA